MKLVVVLAVLCASVLANERDSIMTDLKGAMDSIDNAITTADNMVDRTVTMKLNSKRRCWTRLTNNVSKNSQEVKDMIALKANLTSLTTLIKTESDISPYVAEVLTDANTPITQILNSGVKLVNSLNQVISNLNINTSC